MNKLEKVRSSNIAKLDVMLERHPIRASWIKTANFSWWLGDQETSLQVSDILHKCPAITDLRIYICHPSSLKPLGINALRAVSSQQHIPLDFDIYDAILDSPFANSLQTLHIDDRNILYTDIAKMFTLPALNHFSISQINNQIVEKSQSGPSSHPIIRTKKTCTVPELEIWWSFPPYNAEAVKLLEPFVALQKLTWVDGTRFKDRFLHSAELSTALSVRKETLVELKLSCPQQTHIIGGGRLADFSRFVKLKVLEVDYGAVLAFTFPTLSYPGSLPTQPVGLQPQTVSAPLENRLPSSLEHLIVSLPPITSAVQRAETLMLYYRYHIGRPLLSSSAFNTRNMTGLTTSFGTKPQNSGIFPKYS